MALDPIAERLEVLIAGIAHDLRNPLNTLAMSTGLLKDDLESGDIDPKRELALVIRLERAVDRMRRSIDDLAEASRIGAGRVDVHEKKENAAAIVKDAEAPSANAAKERGAQASVGALDDSLSVEVDRGRLVVALEKVVGFASRLTGEGGSIVTSLEKSGADARFTVVARGRAAAITMPDDNRGGIASIVARAFVELHGSRLEIAIEDGAAVLSFKLPASS